MAFSGGPSPFEGPKSIVDGILAYEPDLGTNWRSFCPYMSGLRALFGWSSNALDNFRVFPLKDGPVLMAWNRRSVSGFTMLPSQMENTSLTAILDCMGLI